MERIAFRSPAPSVAGALPPVSEAILTISAASVDGPNDGEAAT